MTRHRRLGERAGLAIVLGCALSVVAGCAVGGMQDSGESRAGSPTPTAACPAVPGVELPPECAPYDPDAAMAANDGYRERIPLSDEAVAANRELLPKVVVALDSLRSDGAVTPESVVGTLQDAGLTDVQTRGDPDGLLFGAMGAAGGCFYGEITAQTVQIEVGGLILDGGCLPAQ
ncbi:hypothetical protein QSU92_16035 [Microbacterium sp. ET2]|uniref:hypothetical protein n=1 Tax=Microbacterium albipurpureum TaxID=3050384 RepID=UPI00259CB581|nr:hypothetical protein [Microbacterium sp. ET2 (Ac-2212)]WJL95417.1 hypothetical protein QSU92_16035 [Microbacterium sp. ET2 (Ac-2212)]